MRLILITFLVLFSFLDSEAQFKKGFSFESNLHVGKVIKHTPELTFSSPPLTTGIDLNLSWQTYGNSEWQQHQKFPKISAGFMFFSSGERDTLGNAYGIHYGFSIPAFKAEKLGLRFTFGSGLAILDRPFDRLTNPLNNAIGSKLNVIAKMRLLGHYQLSSDFQMTYGLGFTHFSNGASQLPNFGINILTGVIGLVYTPNPLREEDYILHDHSKKSERKLGLRLEYSIGLRESQTNGGPRYPIKTYSLGGVYYLNTINRLLFGIDYEYNRAVYVFGKNTFEFNSEKEAFWGASRIAIFLGDEFVFGDYSMTLQAGAYLGNFSFLVPKPFYFKVIGRYYVPILKKPSTRAFVGVILKSHVSVAEYFAVNVGLEF